MSTAITALIAAIAAIVSPVIQECIRARHEERIKTMEFLQSTLYLCFQEFSDCYSSMVTDFSNPYAKKEVLSSAYRLASMIDDPALRSKIYSATKYALYEVSSVTTHDCASNFEATMRGVAEYISKTQGYKRRK